MTRLEVVCKISEESRSYLCGLLFSDVGKLSYEQNVAISHEKVCIRAFMNCGALYGRVGFTWFSGYIRGLQPPRNS